MKVKELVERLQKLDQEKNIWIISCEGIYEELIFEKPAPIYVMTQEYYKEAVDEVKSNIRIYWNNDENMLRMALKDVQSGDYCFGQEAWRFGKNIEKE